MPDNHFDFDYAAILLFPYNFGSISVWHDRVIVPLQEMIIVLVQSLEYILVIYKCPMDIIILDPMSVQEISHIYLLATGGIGLIHTVVTGTHRPNRLT